VSTILKALKKLEKEKARQSGGEVNLVQDILLGTNAAEARRRASWPIPLLAILLLVAGGVGGMVLVSWLRPSTTLMDRVSAPPGMGPVGGEIPNRSGEPVVSAPVSAIPHTPASPPRADLEPVPVPVEPTKPVVAQQRSAAPPAQAKPVQSPEPSAAPPARAKPVHAPEPSAAPPRPDLVVSGIVYQEDPAGRMAVINDLPVMAGTIVAEAMVEEILQDRVVFSFAGERFEIPLKPSE